MSGPHPDVSAARHALARTFELLPVGATVLLAVSGGADSLALALSAVYAARERAIQLHSLTVDHGLRPESSQEAQEVAAQLTQLGIAARVTRVQLGARRGGEALGPEGEARVARYAALAAEAHRLAQSRVQESGAAASRESPGVNEPSGETGQALAPAVPVLLGHNADEQAETVLLGLTRGSGARSIAGMPRTGGLPGHPEVPMYRPLLDLTRQQLRTVCSELGVPWVEDPTNTLQSEWRAADGSALRRAAIRHEIMPLLAKVFGPGIVPALVRTGQLARHDDEALEQLAQIALAESRIPAGAQSAEVIAPHAAAGADNDAAAKGLDIMNAQTAANDPAAANGTAAARGSITVPNAGSAALPSPDAAAASPGIALRAQQLANYPPAVRTRALRQAALAAQARRGELFYSHIAALDKLVTHKENNVRVDLPGAHAWKIHGVITITPGLSPTAG